MSGAACIDFCEISKRITPAAAALVFKKKKKKEGQLSVSKLRKILEKPAVNSGVC